MTPAELRTARTTLGLSQKRMAEALLMGKHGWQTISAWENGKTPIPGPMVLAVLYLVDQATRAGVPSS